MSHFKGQIEKVKPKHICFKRISLVECTPMGQCLTERGSRLDGQIRLWRMRRWWQCFVLRRGLPLCKTGNGNRLTTDCVTRQASKDRSLRTSQWWWTDYAGSWTAYLRDLLSKRAVQSQLLHNGSKEKRLLKQEMFRAIKAQTDKETQKWNDSFLCVDL